MSTNGYAKASSMNNNKDKEGKSNSNNVDRDVDGYSEVASIDENEG